MRQDGEQRKVPIVEFYRDYAPSVPLMRIVNRLIEGTPSAYWRGIGAIVLTNYEALSRDKKRMKVRVSGRKQKLSESLGWYNYKTPVELASIELMADRLFVDFPRWSTKLKFIQDMVVSETLFHKLGHHLHSTQYPEYDERETVAGKWSKKASKHYFWKKYWYILISFYPFMAIIRCVSMRRSHDMKKDAGEGEQ